MDNCSCQNCISNTFSIFTGDDGVMNLRAQYQGGAPLDLTNCDGVTVNLPNADGSFSALTLTTGVAISTPTVLGQIAVTISEVVSALLNIATYQNFDVTYSINGLKTTVRYYGALSVYES